MQTDKQTTTGTPLWKVLNEKRTGEKWTVINGMKFFPSVVMADIKPPKEDVGTLNYPHPCFVINCSHDQNGESIMANAQYITLAVSNLHILAEVLDEIKQKVLFMEREEDLDEAIRSTLLNEMFHTCREALLKIS